jgi:DNA processing protein
MRNNLKYYIAFSKSVDIGARTMQKLAHHFSSIEEAWNASASEYRKYLFPDKIIAKITDLKSKINPDEELDKIEKLGIKTVTIEDKNYPRLLKEIPDPPALLYYKGELLPQDDLAVAVIGSREYTFYGRQALERLVPPIANSGITIVSGLALGIDSYAHREALKVKNARTLAILPVGVDKVYPACHKGLADEIINGRGAIISEFPIGTPSLPSNFPVRNRIIAGISLATLVIEANIKSGSFITAKAALDYNREVLAVPGSIFSSKSEGTNGLIKMGAKMVTRVEDIFDELNIKQRSCEQIAQNIIPESKEEEAVLKVLDVENAKHVDKIVRDANIDISKLNSILLIMEMKGKVRNIGGNLYIRR